MQPVGSASQDTAADYICVAHNIMSGSPHAVFVTHNDFQGVAANDTTGLVPVWTGISSTISSKQSITSLGDLQSLHNHHAGARSAFCREQTVLVECLAV